MSEAIPLPIAGAALPANLAGYHVGIFWLLLKELGPVRNICIHTIYYFLREKHGVLTLFD